MLEPGKSNREIDLHKVKLGLAIRYSSFESLPDVLLQTSSGCLVVDLVGTGTALVDQLLNVFLQSHYSIPIVALADCLTSEERIALVRAGASEAVERSSGNLNNALRQAIALDNQNNHGPSQLRLRFSTLTAREREVITMFLRGQNAKTIAKRLSVTVQTIDKHRIRALRKFETTSLIDMHTRVTKSLLTGLGIAVDTESMLTGRVNPGMHRIDVASALAGSHASTHGMVNGTVVTPQ